MRDISDLSADEAKEYFLKGSSYFNHDLPLYISFDKMLKNVSKFLNGIAGNTYLGLKTKKPDLIDGVNYTFLANKDGRFAWRPLELIHPLIYVSLVNILCAKENWNIIKNRLSLFKENEVECCSLPVTSSIYKKNSGAQIYKWWQDFEQKSIKCSLEFSHLLKTDVMDCYGSLYTHSISWALYGKDVSKKLLEDKKKKSHNLGDKIDSFIRAGRYGQTNGISQGSVLMDFIAEIVLGYVDNLISIELKERNYLIFKILRYRDDYRIFTNDDIKGEEILKIISDKLRVVGMRLNVGKTVVCSNLIEGAIKEDKLAAINLQDLGVANARTLQKQLLRLHAFGRKYPNSGALKRLLMELFEKIENKEVPDLKNFSEDLEIYVSIVTDIAFISPGTFPVVAGILSYMLALAPDELKECLCNRILEKMRLLPYNGYIEVWLQRIMKPLKLKKKYESEDIICKIVNEENAHLWNNDWINNQDIITIINNNYSFLNDVSLVSEVMHTKEISIFDRNAHNY
ncbi:RNA-directed DNA polymerase [Acetobacteraceae bacterium ESL0709]|nr:RNA-directed DNA polymerase [Acetobacteraceae bacterium ESL0697]MDF7677544.1 RNA-directed DNA polymerase [Acetobacteraceae bacterium ESL0709]